MAAGSNFRHNAAVQPVNGNLRMHRHAQHFASAAQNGGGCFVAGGFNPEYKFIFPAHKAFQRGFTSFGPIQIDFPFQTAFHFPSRLPLPQAVTETVDLIK